MYIVDGEVICPVVVCVVMSALCVVHLFLCKLVCCGWMWWEEVFVVVFLSLKFPVILSRCPRRVCLVW